MIGQLNYATHYNWKNRFFLLNFVYSFLDNKEALLHLFCEVIDKTFVDIFEHFEVCDKLPTLYSDNISKKDFQFAVL